MKTNLVLGVAAAAGVLMSAGGALAQSARDDGYTVNLKKRAPGNSAGGSVTMMMSQSDGDDTYTVRVENGKVTAEVNGKEVPEDRVVREDGQIRIVDENGKTLAKFNDVKTSGNGAFWLGNGNANANGEGQWWSGNNNMRAFRFTPFGQGQPGGPEGQAEFKWTPPKVMIGINMAEPSESLAEHLDLKPGTAILVDKVHEGLPGDKAGLKQGDVIVAIDGESPVTQEKVREVLNSKEAGDTVALVVLRKGEKETVKVKLESYDAEKLGVQPMAGAAAGGEDPGALLEKYAEGVDDKEMQKRIQEAIKQLEDAARNGQFRQGYLYTNPGREGEFRFMAPQPGGDADRRMEELDHRLDELNNRLDDIHAKIDRLMEKFDQLRDRR